MFRSSNLKLYCRFLVLIAMLGCLSFVSYSKQITIPCCDSCDPTWTSCQEYCVGELVKPEHQGECLEACFIDHENCTTHCLTCP